MSFKTPQEAYKYRYKYPNNVIEKVIEGKNTALVLSFENSNSESFYTFPKVDGGYKLNYSIIEDDSLYKSVGKYGINYCKINNEEYIFVSDVLLETPVSNMNISDNLHSHFKQFYLKNNGMYEVYSYTIIDSNAKNYKISINNNIVELN